jgi:hypothetical protein
MDRRVVAYGPDLENIWDARRVSLQAFVIIAKGTFLQTTCHADAQCDSKISTLPSELILFAQEQIVTNTAWGRHAVMNSSGEVGEVGCIQHDTGTPHAMVERLTLGGEVLRDGKGAIFKIKE